MSWFSKTKPVEKASATENRSVLKDAKTVSTVSDQFTGNETHGCTCECQECRTDRRKESRSSQSVWNNGFLQDL